MSDSWFGPWKRLGKILDHSEVPHHNSREHPDYEWGIEGAQLVELPDGRMLLNATCFLPEGARGSRQRVFFAIADKVEGPYQSLGPVLDPGEPGENGHSTVMVDGNELTLVLPERAWPPIIVGASASPNSISRRRNFRISRDFSLLTSAPRRRGRVHLCAVLHPTARCRSGTKPAPARLVKADPRTLQNSPAS